MLFAVFSFSIFAVINTSPARKELQNAIKEIMKVSNDVHVLQALDSPKSVTGDDSSGGCACKGYNCECRIHLEVVEINLNDTVCANFSYLPADYGVSLTFTVDNRTLFSTFMSVRNPPAMCAEVPYLKQYAALCVRCGNLTVSTKSFSGCVDFVATLDGFEIAKLIVGCFKMSPLELPPTTSI